MAKKNQQIPIYFNEDDGTWHFNKKILTSAMEIQYVRDEHGFESPEEAMEAYLAYSRIFKEKIAKISQQKAPDSSLLTDMERWFHKDFIPTRSKATVTGSSYVFYRFIVPSLGNLADKPLTRVTADDISGLIKKADGFCRSSKSQVYKFLSAYFDDAYAEHKIHENIMNPIPPCRPPERRKEIPVYNPDQLIRFLQEARKTIHFFEFFLALLGLRIGEIRGIALQDFSEENRTLSIRRQIVQENAIGYSGDGDVVYLSGGNECKRPKSESSIRIIEVPPITFDLLRERQDELQRMQEAYESKEGRKWNPELDAFLCRGYQGRIKSANTMNASLKRVCSSLGLPKISMHDLRHMTATYLFAYGLDEGSTNDEALERVSRYLGHSSVNITFDIYVHYIKDISRIRDVLDNAADPFLQFSGEWRDCAG